MPCPGQSAADLLAAIWAVDVAGVRVGAEASVKPMYDPKGERVRG